MRVTAVRDAREARRAFTNGHYHLVVLDLMLPGEGGLDFARWLRTQSGVPIVMLTAMGEETDRIIGLEMGADDYVSKPFNPRELLARIKTVLRRANSLPPRRDRPRAEVVRLDHWTVDLGRRELIGEDGVAVPLSTAEFRLLCAFLDHPRTILTREQLLDLTVGRAAASFDRSIDNQVSRLRKKIEADPHNPALIRTHWGGGYSLEAAICAG